MAAKKPFEGTRRQIFSLSIAAIGTIVFLLTANEVAVTAQRPPRAEQGAAVAQSAGSPAKLAWTTNATSIGGPVVSYKVAMALLDESGQLTMRAWGTATGAPLWHVPYTLSAIGPLDVDVPAVVDGVAFDLYPAPKSVGGGVGAVLEGVNIYDGALKWSVPNTFIVYAPPMPCSSAPTNTRFCVILSGASNSILLAVFDARTGNVLAEYGGVTRILAPGLYQSEAAPPSLVGIDPTTGTTWKQPISSIFGSSAFNLDYGWEFSTFGSVVVGSVNAAPVHGVANLSTAETVGLSASTGRLLWRHPGSFWCGGVFPITSPYRCVETGKIVQQGGNPTVSPGATARIEGFSPTTGASTWTIPFDNLKELAAGTGVEVAGPSTVVVPAGPSRAEALDLATGHATPITASSLGWCKSLRSFTYAATSGTTTHLASPAYSACNGLGQSVSSLPAPSPPIGETSSDGYLIWATPSTIEGERLVPLKTLPKKPRPT